MRISSIGARLALALGCVSFVFTLVALICLVSVACNRESFIDSVFPPLIVLAPVAIVGMALAPTMAGFTLMAASRGLTRRQQGGCWFAIGASVVQAALLWFVMPTRAAPAPPTQVSRTRMMAVAHELRKSVRSVNWSKPNLERGTSLVGREREYLEDAMALYRSLSQSGDGRSEARYWLALCEAAIGQRRSALLHLGWEQSYAYYSLRPGISFNYPANPLSARVQSLRRRLLEVMIHDTSPRQLQSQLASMNDEGRNVEDALLVARAFAARRQWRRAAWLLKLATDRTEWMWRHQPQSDDVVEVFAFLAHCYDEWARVEPRHARILHELAGKALQRAAPLAQERALELHARAGEQFLQGGSPLRALFQLRRAKNLDPRKKLPVRFQPSLAQAQTAVERLVGAKLVEKRMQDLNQLLALLDQQRGYGEGYFEQGRGGVTYQMKQIIDNLANLDDSLIDDMQYLIVKRQRNVQHVWQRANRREAREARRRGANTIAVYRRRRQGVTGLWVMRRVARPLSDSVLKLRELLAHYPTSDVSAELTAEIIRLQYPHDLRQRLGALADALRRYPDHPGTATLLRDVWTAVRSFVGATGRAPGNVPGASAEFCEAVKVLAQICRAQLLVEHGRPWPDTAATLAAIDLGIPNALLRDLLDIALIEKPDLAPSGAPARAGLLYFGGNDYPRAAAQFARALEHPDVYSHLEIARFGLALCKPRMVDLFEVLAALATHDAVETMPGTQTGLFTADKSERAIMVAAAFATHLSDEALQQSARSAAAGFQREVLEAQILRMQRAREFRRLAHAVEEFTVNYPNHRDTTLLFARLCSVERRAIPNEGIRIQSQAVGIPEGSRFPKGRDLSTSDSATLRGTGFRQADGIFERWARITVRVLARAAQRVRFDGALPFDDDAFAARATPTWFRLRRVAHRALNRLAWNAHIRREYDTLPCGETARFDLADWHFRDDYGSAVVVDHRHALDNQDALALPALRQVADSCWSNSRCLSEHADGRVIAGPMMEEVVRRFPHSKLKRRALLTALESHQAALKRESLQEDSPRDRAQARELFARARADFVTLRDEFPRTADLIEAAHTWHGIRETRAVHPRLFGLGQP